MIQHFFYIRKKAPTVALTLLSSVRESMPALTSRFSARPVLRESVQRTFHYFFKTLDLFFPFLLFVSDILKNCVRVRVEDRERKSECVSE